VLALGVPVRVVRDPPRDDLAVGRHDVDRVGGDDVASRPARDPVAHAVDGLDPVGALRPVDRGRGRNGDKHEPGRHDRAEKG
jgi:hypothetical protein